MVLILIGWWSKRGGRVRVKGSSAKENASPSSPASPASLSSLSSSSSPIIKAQGWLVSPAGAVHLVADVTLALSHPGWQSIVNCSGAERSQLK